MTPTELRVRVTLTTVLAAGALAAAAGGLAGGPAALGVLASGALTIANFLWLARGAAALRADGASRVRAGAWALAVGGRLTLLAAALGALLASGWAHPVAVVAGLAVLPAAVIAAGLGAAWAS